MAKDEDSNSSENSRRRRQRKAGLTRSKSGCFTCRKRRKKCDGQNPICGHCLRLRLDCRWPDIAEELSESTDLQLRTHDNQLKSEDLKALVGIDNDYVSSFSEFTTPDGLQQNSTTTFSRAGSLPLVAVTAELSQAELEAAKWLESQKEITNNMNNNALPRSFIAYDDVVHEPDDHIINGGDELWDLEEEFVLYPEPLSRSFVFDSPFGMLDHEIKILLDYFETEFAPLISVSPRRSNNLLRVFLPMAAQNKAVLCSLAGWSATHLRDIDDKFKDQSRSLMSQATAMLDKLMNDPLERDKDTTLAVSLIICAVEVCKDTDSDWAKYKDHSYDIIQRRDLIRQYSTADQAFLLLNYAYHNCLASNGSLAEETSIPGLETQQILTNVPAVGGPDCYLGICAPLYCLISQVTSLRTRIYLDDLGQRGIATFASRMIVSIDNCEPHPLVLASLGPEDRPQHLIIWKILKLVAKLYLNQVILHYPACNASSQAIIAQTMPLFSSLKTTLAEMLFPLFIVGVDAMAEDRGRIAKMMEIMFERFRIGNVRCAYSVLEHTWEKNHAGQVFVDWNEITLGLSGQVLSFA